MPEFLSEPSRIGTEISDTGKWVPSKPGGRFRKSAESQELENLESEVDQLWADVRVAGRSHPPWRK